MKQVAAYSVYIIIHGGDGRQHDDDTCRLQRADMFVQNNPCARMATGSSTVIRIELIPTPIFDMPAQTIHPSRIFCLRCIPQKLIFPI